MSVERIALDSKVEAQGLVEALAGKEALPMLAEVQSQPNSVLVRHRPIALTCTAHVLPAIDGSRVIDSASGTELVNLNKREVDQSLRKQESQNPIISKQIRGGSITSDSGSMQKVGGPVAHHACRY